ncbi:MAG: hypothetical protein WBR29_13105 [Gammaproteobacteria bacterium]
MPPLPISTTNKPTSHYATPLELSKLLLAQARTVLDQADNSDRWHEGRHYMQAAVREGSSEACKSMAFCHLTGENGFQIDPAAALEYMNSWRRSAMRALRTQVDKPRVDIFEKVSAKFAALWRRCTTEIKPDSALAMLGRTIVGYRLYQRYPGTQGPKEILVLELDDGSAVEIINHFGSIDPVGSRVVGGQRELDSYMQNHWSSRLSVARGEAVDASAATALYHNHEFEIFKKWSAR